ncbi:hypothetical protein DM872_06455 [Pseudomonas taiwanensis]|uniref:DUF2934 domain-containing protein n=1 Tax=Pseudomonas taiwanensis TaxID=470150 RepID=UPI0015BF49AC|nr:DUF2934 domain-containing protein [Pseudomonas taiwanensis]NWL76490.1 hypothetical protein [Pseudomonas taiwanensis]
MSDEEARIRELAYQIWESEGCPEGQSTRHWQLACVLAEIAHTPTPAEVVRTRRVTKPEPVEPAKAPAPSKPSAPKSITSNPPTEPKP